MDQGQRSSVCEVDGCERSLPVLHHSPSLQWGHSGALATTEDLCPQTHLSNGVQQVHGGSRHVRPDDWHKLCPPENEEMAHHCLPTSA